jgi:hypothetical protein
LVEQRTENPRVAGSIPALGTISYSCPEGRLAQESLFLAKAAVGKSANALISSGIPA